MNRSMFLDTFCSSHSIHIRVVIAIFFVTAIQTPLLIGQEDRAFAHLPGMVMHDNSIPDFVAMTKLEGIFGNKEKEFGYLSRAKKHSLEIRKKYIQNTQEKLVNRSDITERGLNRFQRELKEMEAKAQSKSYVYASSMASAEQLLISAQLELQKVTWDLASEQELLESIEKAELSSKPVANEIEREKLVLESQNIQSELQMAEADFANVQALERKGAVEVIEVAKAKHSLTKAKNALMLSELRLSEQQMKNNALKQAQIAELKTLVLKLTAKKTHIEKYLKELHSSMNDLRQRQTIQAKIDHLERQLAENATLQWEWVTKQDEIDGMLSLLDAVELTEKKAKE